MPPSKARSRPAPAVDAASLQVTAAEWHSLVCAVLHQLQRSIEDVSAAMEKGTSPLAEFFDSRRLEDAAELIDDALCQLSSTVIPLGRAPELGLPDLPALVGTASSSRRRL